MNPAHRRFSYSARPLSRSYRLYRLSVGETFLGKAHSLVAQGIRIAPMPEILEWMRNDPDLNSRGEIVIADPTVAPAIYGSEPHFIYQIPAHVSLGKGTIHENGAIDLFVPAREGNCGTLAVLGILPE